jgi:hypothetical protein
MNTGPLLLREDCHNRHLKVKTPYRWLEVREFLTLPPLGTGYALRNMISRGPKKKRIMGDAFLAGSGGGGFLLWREDF